LPIWNFFLNTTGLKLIALYRKPIVAIFHRVACAMKFSEFAIEDSLLAGEALGYGRTYRSGSGGDRLLLNIQRDIQNAEKTRGVIQRMPYLADFFGCSSLYAMMKLIRAMTRMPANTK
jgi:hypothetical protein